MSFNSRIFIRKQLLPDESAQQVQSPCGPYWLSWIGFIQIVANNFCNADTDLRMPVKRLMITHKIRFPASDVEVQSLIFVAVVNGDEPELLVKSCRIWFERTQAVYKIVFR